MAAGGVALACILAAIVIDGAAVALHARQLQGAADLAALSAAADLPRATEAAEATVHANTDPERIVVTTGIYAADLAVQPSARFRLVREGETPNAARVAVSGATPLFFGRLVLGRETLTLNRSAVAAVRTAEPMAVFSIGSRLARLDAGLANQVLGGLTDSEIALTAMDYRALADARVDLLAFTDALATHAGVRAGDYEALMDATVDAGDALRIVERTADGTVEGLNGLASALDGKSIRIGQLLGLDAAAPDGLRGELAAGVSALDLAGALIEIAGEDRQVRLDLGARAGLADVDVWLAVGERPNRSPWLTVARDGSMVVRTAQARLYIEARTAQSLAGLAQVKVPVLVELASAEARLEDIRCRASPAVTLGVRPGLARVGIGAVDKTRLDDFTAPLSVQTAVLVQLAGLARVSGRSETEAASPQFVGMTFDAAAIRDQTPKTVRSNGLIGGALSSTLERLTLQVDVVGLGLGLGDLASATRQLLRPVGAALDELVEPLLATLGLSLGEADVTVHGVSCPDRTASPALVG